MSGQSKSEMPGEPTDKELVEFAAARDKEQREWFEFWLTDYEKGEGK